MKQYHSKISFLGVRVDNLSLNEVRAQFESYLHTPKAKLVATVNPEFIMRAQHDVLFRSVLASSDLAVPDGAGLLFVSRLVGLPLRERVTGADLTETLAALAAHHRVPVGLFGAEKGRAAAAAASLQRKYPQLKISGAENECTEDGKERSEEEIIERLRAQSPVILLVGLGAPKQEFFLTRVLPQLPSVRIAMGIGGTIDYLAGAVHRSPKILQKLWFEWLWRLLLQPKRLGRIVTATILFPLATLFRRNAVQPTD